MKAIDLFAGAGGFSEGAKQAGYHVVWAANHWKTAIDVHSLNHPDTVHSCQDLQQANFYEVPDCDIILGSPACQGHSRAKGKEKPHHDNLRATAWAVVSAVEAKHPEYIVVENVIEFLKWGLYPIWKMALEKLGYSLSENILNASEFGVPQNRKRVFIIGSKSRNPIAISSPKSKAKAAKEIIDWDLGSWKPIEKLSQNTTAKIKNSYQSLGHQFLIAYYGSEKIGRSIDKPIGSILTKDKFLAVRGDQYRMLTIDEYRRAMGFESTYKLTGIHSVDLKLLGNAVCPPVAKSICLALRSL